jgi:hypothetical protein
MHATDTGLPQNPSRQIAVADAIGKCDFVWVFRISKDSMRAVEPLKLPAVLLQDFLKGAAVVRHRTSWGDEAGKRDRASTGPRAVLVRL